MKLIDYIRILENKPDCGMSIAENTSMKQDRLKPFLLVLGCRK